MSKYNNLDNNEITNAQDPLSPLRPFGSDNINKDDNNQNKNLTPNSAFPIVKNKIFEMYDIHPEGENNLNK